MSWSPQKGAPYVIDSDEETLNLIAGNDMVRGVTISCGGFFGPQGRVLRVPLADPYQNAKLENFEYNGHRITNFETVSYTHLDVYKRQMQKRATILTP